MSLLAMYAGAEELEALVEDTATDVAEEVAKAEVAELAVVVEEQSQQIEQLVEEVKELDENVEELEENVEGMEALLSQGGFNATAMANLYRRSAKLNAKLGGRTVGSRLGAESFADQATATLVSRDGMEGFMETIKDYAKKAGEWIKHIFNTVINFFVGLVNRAAALQRRHDQLKKRLAEAKDLKEKVKLGGWNVYFDYEKNGLDAKGTESLVSALESVGGLAEVGKSVDVNLASFNAAYKKLTDALEAAVKKTGKALNKKADEKNTVIGMHAGIRVMATFKEGTAAELKDAPEYARSIKVTIGKDADAKKLASGEVAAKLKKGDLEKVLAEVNTEIAGLRDNKVAAAFGKAVRDKVVGQLNNIKAGDETKAKEVNQSVALVKAIYASCASLGQSFTKLGATVTGAQLDGVAAHI